MSLPLIKSFSTEFSSVLENRHQDPLLRVLVLTFEFDEKQLLNLACARSLEEDFELRQSQMKTLCDLRPVVVYDARKTRETARLPQFLELHPVHAGAFACHHSKAYLLVTRETVRLALGSFNLTETGLFKNRELFELFRWDKQHGEHVGLLRQWTEFLERDCVREAQGSSRSALQEVVGILRQRLESLVETPGPSSFDLVTSGYPGAATGLEQLARAWERHFPGQDPEQVLVVTPFFDLSPKDGCFASDLGRQFPSLRGLEIVTSEIARAGLGRNHFGDFGERSLYCTLDAIQGAERERLQRQGLGEDSLPERKLHAKLLCLVRGDSALVYGGSANFTRKAWGTSPHSNRELGVVQVIDDFARWKQGALACLCSGKQDLYPKLPPLAPAPVEEDDEGYAETNGFPDFLAWVQVAHQEDGELRFVFHAASSLTTSIDQALAAYRIEWGRLELRVRDGKSQAITPEQFRERMVGGRNLRLVPHGFEKVVHWFPFQYGDFLVEERANYVHPSVWDWFDFHLNPSSQSELLLGEFLPGQTAGQEADGWGEVDREANPVIRMQAYLSRFAKAEGHFGKALLALEEAKPEHRSEQLEQTVLQPLASLLNLLVMELRVVGEQRRTDAEFQMGELALYLSGLRARAASCDRPGLEKLVGSALGHLEGLAGKPGLGKDYVDFVSQQVGAR